jgi:enoyl-CoA hydratase/carnithine racemase
MPRGTGTTPVPTWLKQAPIRRRPSASSGDENGLLQRPRSQRARAALPDQRKDGEAVSGVVYESTERLQVELDGQVLVMRLNRPEALNAFDDELHMEFAQLLVRLEGDVDLRAVLLTGNGKAFSAGGSIDEFDHFRVNFGDRRKAMRQARRLVDEMINLHVPVVAAVNGAAVGLGATLMTLCDIVFMSEKAFVADPHVGVALVAGDGAAVTWPAYTSLLKVKQYVLTGDRIPAAEALAMGLANFVVPPDDLLPQALAFAQRIAAQPPQAVQESKAILNQILRQNAVGALGYGLAAESQSHDTVEYAAIPEQFRARSKS